MAGSSSFVEAARVDFDSRLLAAGIGTEGIVASASIVYGPPDYFGLFNLATTSEVRENAGGVFTYFYTLFNNSHSDEVVSWNVAGNWSGSEFLNWGIINPETVGTVTLDASPGDIEFGDSLTANFANLPNSTAGGIDRGEAITIYVQSYGLPNLYDSSAIDHVVTTGQAYAPGDPYTPTPEPGTIALLGSGIVGLVGTARRRRQRKQLL